MKILAIMILGLGVVGCGDLIPTPTEQTAIKASPAKELTPEERKVVGTYETRVEGNTHRVVLLENGVYEDYLNGKKHEVEYEWKINKEGELIFEYKDGYTVFIIYEDGNINHIARIDKNGKRKDYERAEKWTWKKIK